MALLTVRTLGTLEISLGERPLTGFRTLRNQLLLVYLLLEAESPLPRTLLAGLLWPDKTDTAARLNLRQSLFQLRTVLGDDADVLLVTPTAVQRNPVAKLWVDVAEFERIHSQCRLHDHSALNRCASCMARLDVATALVQGEFLRGLYVQESPALEEWLLLRREQLRRQQLDSLALLTEWALFRSAYDQAIALAGRQLELDLLSEEAHRQLMTAYAYSGRRAQALQQYDLLARHLRKELGVDPSEATETLVGLIQADVLPAAGAAPPSPVRTGPTAEAPAFVRRPVHNIPAPLTTLLGRERELGRLRERLLDPAVHLVTLVGPGGTGKTRLAQAVGVDVATAFSHGACFVALASVSAETGVVTALLDSLQVTGRRQLEPLAQLQEFLSDRELLLVLDNFEHMAGQATLLQQLLSAAPQVKLLVTSRARLNLTAEHAIGIEGLQAPGRDIVAGDELRTFPAVCLFLQRAAQHPWGFEEDAETLQAIAEICRLLDGSPLGIEMAASWVEHYTCQEIAAEIRHNIGFLESRTEDGPERHRSLRAVFDYSWRLLSPGEQAALAGSSVFAGPFSREAIIAICGVSMQELTALVQKSLLRPAAPGRFVLHELVRQMAAEKLALQPSVPPPVTNRHATYYLHLVAAAESELAGPALHRSTARLRAEIDNLRLAWRWAVSARAWALLNEALPALALFFDLVGLMPELKDLLADAATALERAMAGPPDAWPAEGRRLLAGLDVYSLDALRMVGDAGVAVAQAQRALAGAEAVGDLALQILAHNKYAGLLYRTGQKQESLNFHRLSLQLAQRLGNERLIAMCQMSLGDALVYLGDAEAGTFLYAALATQRRIRDRRAEGWTLNSLGVFNYFQGDLSEARRCYEDALAIFRETGDQNREGKATNNLANILAGSTDFSGAERSFRRALQLARETGDRDSELFATANLGDCYRSLGRFAEAREWLMRAGHLARQLEHKRSQSYLNGMLAQLEVQSGNYGAAQQYLVEAVRIAEETDEHLSRLSLLGRLCALCWTMGQLERALAAAQDEEKVARWTGDKAHLANGMLAQVHLQLILGNVSALTAVGERLRPIAEDDSIPALQIQAMAMCRRMQSEWARRQPLPSAWADGGLAAAGGDEQDAIARTYSATQTGWYYLEAGELALARQCFTVALAGVFDAFDPRTGRWAAVIGAAWGAVRGNELEQCRPFVQEVAGHWLAQGAADFPDPPAAWQLLAAAVAHEVLPANAAWMPGMLATAMQPLLLQMTDPAVRQHFLNRLARIDAHSTSPGKSDAM